MHQTSIGTRVSRRHLLALAGVGAGGAALLGVAGRGGISAQTPQATPGATRPFEHALGTTDVPVNPQRVVTLQDQNALLPLWELGFRNVVGSVGAQGEGGEPYFRRMQDYDTSDIEFVGVYGEPDLEAVVALDPDLIVAAPFDEGIAGVLQQIAPTVFIDVFDAPIDVVMMRFATLVGLEAEAERLDAEYRQRLEDLRASVDDPADVVISVISTAASGGAAPGQFYISPRGQGAVDEILVAVGFARPVEQLTAEERTYFSIEQLRTQDADLLLRVTFGQNPEAEEENTAAVLESPLWEQLNAVQKGQAHDVNGEATIGTGYGPRMNFIDVLIPLLDGIDTSGDLSHVEVGTP